MSGAAEGIAGLALSAVSVAALFTTCIECFDIVVAGKNFSEDYEQLCALFSLQRARFGLWGESVGLVPNPNNGQRLRYDKNLDRPDIRPGVERILNNIKSLLDEAGRVDDRYGLSSNAPQGSEVSTSKGLDIFKGSFERFKFRIRKHQKETSAWKVTRWAIHDADKFENMINRLKGFVDGLESITKSLGLLQAQHKRLRQEIESISDTQSLRLLRDASSRHSSHQQEVSDAASQRLITVASSFIETQTLNSSSQFPETTDSFVTARSRPSGVSVGLLDEDQQTPGAWPRSLKSASRAQVQQRTIISNHQSRGFSKPRASCEKCQEHCKCVPAYETGQCAPFIQMKKNCSSAVLSASGESEPAIEHLGIDSMPESALEAQFSQGLPQHQRLLTDLISKAKPRKPLSFAAGDAHYGKRLASIKTEDEQYWLDHSVNILGQARDGSSAAKRMFFELRNIRAGKVPFVSAVPIDDCLAKILASIEGPPETPYEGGIFFITVKLSNTDPFGAPLMRFHTRIYHPNILPDGHICADYKGKWNAMLSGSNVKAPVSDTKALWFRGKSCDTQWSLGALLTALCGLLATPNVEDPLVPEIAQKYLEDYDGYCKNARLYTQRFATGPRPEYNDLAFPEELPTNASEVVLSGSNGSWPRRSSKDRYLAEVPSLSGSFDSVADGESISDTLSLSSSLLPTYDEVLNPLPPTNLRFNDDIMPSMQPRIENSDLEEALSLHSILNGGLLASRWNSIQSGSNNVLFSSSSSRLADLILVVRESHSYKIPKLGDEATDLNICYGLLEKARLFRESKHAIYLSQYSSLSAFYHTVRDICEEYLVSWLAHGSTEVSVVRDSSTAAAMYQITIVNEAKDKKWVFTRKWREIEALNTQLLRYIPDARLWGWNYIGHHRSVPLMPTVHPFTLAVFLQYGLSRTFKYHARKLLMVSEILSLLGPEIVSGPKFETQDEIFLTTSGNLARVFHFESFIPSALIRGIAARYFPPYKNRSVFARFEVDKSGSFVKICGLFAEILQIYVFNIVDINLSRIRPKVIDQSRSITTLSELEAINRFISITERPSRPGEKISPREILFDSPDDARLCFDTLQLLRQVDKLLRADGSATGEADT